MKKTNAATPLRRAGFDQELHGYSTLSTAALATTAVFGTAATASAQVHNLTLASFTQPSGPSFDGVAPRIDFEAATAGPSHAVAAFAHFTTANGAHFGFAGFNRRSRNTGSGFGSAKLAGTIAPAVNHSSFAAKIASTAHVSRRTFAAGPLNLAHVHQGSPGSSRSIIPVQGANHTAMAYIGFKNVHGGQTYYGWLRVKVTDDQYGLPTAVALVAKDGTTDIDGAYGLIGSSLSAGQVASAIPEPASVATGLALFAPGAAGVHEHRRRTAAAAA